MNRPLYFVLEQFEVFSFQASDKLILVIGDGDDRERLHLVARQAGVEDKVVFVGYARPGDLADYYRVADVFVMPSTQEGFGIVLLEAMAGDATLFIRRDEVESAWEIVDSVRRGWENKPLSNREFYAAGTWGPVAADQLLALNGHTWRNPQPMA